MSLYSRYILPRLIERTCAVKPVRRQREKIVPRAAGRVLEIGVGSGLNFPHYDRTRVERVFGLDIAPELMSRAAGRAEAAGIAFEPLILDAATIPLEAREVDTVLVTYALCSIDALGAALGEMRRVLKPAGQLVFCEHGAAPDASVLRWQRRITPIWRRIGGGCRLDRDLPAEIEAAGFRLTSLETMYLPGTARIFGFNAWGTAAPA